MHLSLSFLGPYRVALDGVKVVGFGSAKALALLAFLVTEVDRPHRREALAEMLWPDRPTADGLGNLRSVLSRLRRAIGDHEARPPFLLITRDAIQFNPNSDYHVDVEALTRSVVTASGSGGVDAIREAVGAYRGRFLEGLSVEESPGFQEWLLLKQEEVERDFLGALSRLADHSEGEEDYQAAESYARRQLELEPWREEAHRQLMRALAAQGQRAAALAQYQTCRRVLADDLSAEPAPETISLYQDLRQGTQDGRVAGAATSASVAFPEDLPEGRPSAFVGRERELAQLARYLDRAVSGVGQVAFVIGDPGSGKTMLLYEFARRALEAHPDLVVASGSGNAYTGTGDPYLPFLDLLRMLTGDVQARHSRGAITREQARRLWLMLPEAAQVLVQHGPDLIGAFVPRARLLARARATWAGGTWLSALEAAVGHQAPSPPQPQLFEQYTEVVQALARGRPLLLTVDDLQWADRGSIDLLFHLGRRLADSPILLLGAYRPGEVALGREGERHPLEPVANELRSQYATAPVDLDRAEARAFVDALVDREANRLSVAFRDTLYHHTDGHPLFAVELLADLRDRGGLRRDGDGLWFQSPDLDWEGLPARLEAMIAERVGRLPDRWRRLLEVASLEGEEFTAEVVASVLQAEPKQVVDYLSGPLSRHHHLVQAQSLERLGEQKASRYRFRHYLFQRYLYQEMDTVERARLHEEVGQALESLWKDRPEEIALQLAWHYQEAGLELRAAQCYLQAAQRAGWMAAPAAAETHYRQGLALMQCLPDDHRDLQTEMRLQAGLCLVAGVARSAASPELTPLYERALELCRCAGDTRLILQVLGELEYQHEARAEYGRALAVLAESFEPIIAGGDVYALAWAQQTFGRILHFSGRLEPARLYLERALAWIAPIQDEFSVLMWSRSAWQHLAKVLCALGYPEQGLRRGDELCRMLERFGRSAIWTMARGITAWCHHELYRDRSSLEECTDAAEVFAKETGGGWRDAGAFVEAYRGYVLVHTGQAMAGAQSIRAAVGSLVSDGFFYDVPVLLHWLSEAYNAAAQPDAGLKAAALGLQLARSTGQRFAESPLHRTMGDLLRRRGRPDDEWLAEARYRSAIEVAKRQEAKLFELQAATGLARLWRDQGKRQEAHHLLSDVYGWFTEGFDTYDLRRARALLEELS